VTSPSSHLPRQVLSSTRKGSIRIQGPLRTAQASYRGHVLRRLRGTWGHYTKHAPTIRGYLLPVDCRPHTSHCVSLTAASHLLIGRGFAEPTWRKMKERPVANSRSKGCDCGPSRTRPCLIPPHVIRDARHLANEEWERQTDRDRGFRPQRSKHSSPRAHHVEHITCLLLSTLFTATTSVYHNSI
jgi:hypothetical protein